MADRAAVAEEFYEAWRLSSIEEIRDVLTRYCAPDFTLELPREWPDQRIYNGVDGALQMVANITETWNDWHWDIDQLIDVADGLLVLVRLVATGAGSGVAVHPAGSAHHWSFDDGGLVTSMRVYLDRDEGRSAAGLDPAGP